MIENRIKVCWIEEKYIPSPIETKNLVTEKDWSNYKKELERTTIRKYGYIIDFITNIFGKTKAIIDSGDNKIVKINIEKLVVVHDKSNKK